MKLTLLHTIIFALFLSIGKSSLAIDANIGTKSNLNSLNQITPSYAQVDNENFNLKLFIQAIRKFLEHEQFELESQFKITGELPGANVEFNIKTKTIISAPNKFHSLISFSDDNDTDSKKYEVISDGNQVWIHNHQQKQYSVMDYVSFQDSEDAFLIGMLSSLFIEIVDDTEGIQMLSSLSEDELLLALTSEFQTDLNLLQSNRQTLNGVEYITYTYTDPEETLTMTGFVNPSKQEFERLDITEIQGEFNIRIEEEIVKKTILPSIPSDTFTFTPPKDVEKVDIPISIEPF